MQQDRYCRDCGQELKPEDKFCAGCGRSVYDTAHVPTPEADVTVPPVPPPQDRQRDVMQDPTRGPKWGMFVVFLVLVVGRTAIEMPPVSSGGTFAYRLGSGMAIPLVLSVFLAAFLLLIGGVYYVTARKDGATFGDAFFNWPMVTLAGVVVFLSIL